MAGQSIVVTGAGSGIGLSAVKLLLADPRVVLVVAVDLQTGQLEELAAQSGSRLHIVQGDVSQRQTNKDAVEAAVRRTGSLEAVILNAGILGPVSPVTEGDVDGWKKTLDVNFFGPLHGIQTAFPHLSKSGGRIILTSSGVSLRLTKSWAAYSCSKAALNHLCASLAHEEPSISAISVTPGIVDTGIQKLVRDQHKDTLDPDMYHFLVDIHIQGNLLHPDQPAASLVKLALDGIPQEIRGQVVAWDDDRVKK